MTETPQGTETPTRLDEIISPEGVEERVIKEFIFRLTMTGGGKFRVYVPMEDGTFDASRNFDDKEEGMKQLGGAMIIVGGILHSPKETFEMMFKNLKNPKDRK